MLCVFVHLVCTVTQVTISDGHSDSGCSDNEGPPELLAPFDSSSAENSCSCDGDALLLDEGHVFKLELSHEIDEIDLDQIENDDPL